MSRTRSHPLSRPASRASRRPARLQVELLEDRCVPAGTLSVVPFTSLNPQPTEGAAFTGQVATAFDTGLLPPTFTISIDWGDGTAVDTTSGVATPIAGSPNAFLIAGTHTYAEESGSTTPPFSFPVKVTVSDSANLLGPNAVTGQADVVDASLSQGNPVTATPTPFLGGGTAQPTAAAELTAFEGAIGGVKNTTAAPQTSGFRVINWDGVKTDGTDAAAGAGSTTVITPHTVGIPLNRFEGSGVYFGAVYAVSNDGFVDVNPSVGAPNPVLLPAFSSPNTFAMFNDNGIDFKFVAPASTSSDLVSASSRGFGAIFLNVEQANTTTIQYFNGNNLLTTVSAPVGGKGNAVFAGALFNNPVVTRVLLTLGTDVIFKFDGTTVTSGPTDSGTGTGTNLVSTDDWAFAEPVPTANGLPIVTGAQGTANAVSNVSPTAGVAFTGTVASFSDLDPNGNARDYTATINWGDGHLTNGTIKANAGGGFDVSGTNTYAKPGLFPINVDIADFGGGNGISGSLPTVSVNNTATVGAPAPVPETIGGFDPGSATFFLRNENTPGAPDAGTFAFGAPGDLPVVGNWGVSLNDTIGVFDPTTATWYLRNSNTAGPPDFTPFQYGAPGDVPIVGDWTGTGHSGIGVFDPRTGSWLLRNEVSPGGADAGVFQFGAPGLTPVVGNWFGTSHDGIGVFDSTTGNWFLRNEASAGGIDAGTFQYGGPGFRPVTGDWTGVGHTGIGVFNPGNVTCFLRTEVGPGVPDAGTVPFGTATTLPLAGTYVVPAHLFLAPSGDQPVNAAALSEAQLQGAVQAALARLGAAGVSPAVLGTLASADYEVAALPRGVLGQTNLPGHSVALSATAAGQGWFVDPTPGQDEEYVSGGAGSPLVALAGSPAAGGVDLLTAVLHEMGHLAGRPDLGSFGGPDDLMADTLSAGVRRVDALTQVFAGG